VIASFRFLTALTKLLARVSVYELVPCVVSRRAREVGIRMVLATNKLDTTMPVPRRAIWPAKIGTPVALAFCVTIAGILSRNLSSDIFVRLLCGIGLPGPVSFLLVPGFLLSAALLLSYVAARRVTDDSMLALRHEWV
jgi:hypothetical protein